MEAQRRTAAVTGGNSGIGYETAKMLVRRGWRVILTGRHAGRLEEAAAALAGEGGGEVTWAAGDFASLTAVRRLAARLSEEPRLDVLINNAGVALTSRQTTEDGNDMLLQVNHLAPFLLTNLLLPRLRASAPARIINVSSRMHRLALGFGFDDFQFERTYGVTQGYARTKLYNLLFTRELARRLAGTDVTVNAFHPGALATRIGMDGDMTGPVTLFMAAARRLVPPPERGAEIACFLATAPELAGVTGEYFVPSLKTSTPGPLACDDAAARRLWDMSAAATGLAAEGA